MKKQLLSCFCVCIFCIAPNILHAETPQPLLLLPGAKPVVTDALTQYDGCKKKALAHREKTMSPARLQYLKESYIITENAKTSFEKISWYINTSYRTNSKKILDQKKKEMLSLQAKIGATRKSAATTYQAELALCDLNYAKLVTKTTRSNNN